MLDRRCAVHQRGANVVPLLGELVLLFPLRMLIERLDPSDTARVESAVSLFEDAQRVDYPGEPKLSASWERGRIKVPSPGSIQERWIALDGHQHQGMITLELPQYDNVASVVMELTVHPPARRRGVGISLLNHAITRTIATGRKVLITEATMGGQTERFLRRSGATLGVIERWQKLAVEPGSGEVWNKLLNDALPYAHGYRIVRWGSITPEKYTAGMAALRARMSTDAPHEQLEWTAENWSSERIRQWDKAVTEWGRRCYTTVAVDQVSGGVAAYTTLSYAKEDPAIAWQWNTLVDPAHRGHKLGTVIKAENLAFALEREKETSTIVTSCAESNAPMNSINYAFGFRPSYRLGRWQIQAK